MPGSSKLALNERRLGPWARAAFAFGGLWLALALSSLVLRQGLASAWDEVEVHSLLQMAREGLALPLGLGRGSLWLRSLAALLWLPGFKPGFLHAPVLLGLLLEGLLLWNLLRRLGGSPAQACVAVAVHFGSRLTWLRGATVLGFSLAPLWALAAWSVCLQARGWVQGLLAGLVSGLLLGEYEACLVAGPGLAWLSWRRHRERDAAGIAFMLGLLLAWALLFLLLPDGFAAHYAQVRGHSLAASASSGWAEWGHNLAAFFGGWGKPLQDVGLGSALSLVGLLLALRGLRRLPTEAWLFLGAGLALLAAPAPGQTEAHRAAVAWAPLCVAAGLGAPSSGRRAVACLIALAALIAWDARAYSAQRDGLEAQRYEYSWRVARAAQRLQGEPVNSALNFRSMGAFRLRHQAVQGLPAWCLFSGEQVGPTPPARWGTWHPIQQAPGLGTLWLLKANAAQRLDWYRRAGSIQQVLQTLTPMSWQDQLAVIDQLLREPRLDDFDRRFYLDRALWAAKDVGLPLKLVQACATASWLSARQCLALAVALQGLDRPQALRLVERAVRLDPQRLGALRLRDELRAQGQP